MLTMRKIDKLANLIEKCLWNSGQSSTPVRPRSWSNFNACSHAGGIIVIRNFLDRSEVLSLEESIIFTCTGLGAAQLFGDETLTPIKGQLVFLPPDPDVEYATLGGGKGILHMFPRTDVILLGGIYRIGDSSRNVEPEETERIVTEHQRLFASLG
jgi:hypothetical protein